MENTKKEEHLFFIAFNNLINFTWERYKLLLKSFPSLEQAFYASASELLRAGWKADLASSFVEKRKSFNLEKIWQKILAEDIKVVVISDNDYPFFLSKIYSPPPVLYYRGNLNINWYNSLSVVGSRKFSYYGEKIAQNLLPNLLKSGLNIISGLAIGIDSLAHQVSLNNNGQTIAVLGAGLDYESIYPRSNRKLFQDIIDNNGLVLSEFPLGTKPLAFNFPQRNRVIAGLSRATLVIEAGECSGSLITAKYALDEGREVLAVPGSIYDDNFKGNNRLIKSGAELVSDYSDILGIFNLLPFATEKEAQSGYQGENEAEKQVLQALSARSYHIDELFDLLSFNISEISSALAILEIKGVVRDRGGKNYEKA